MAVQIKYISYDNSDLELKKKSVKILNDFFKNQSYHWNENQGAIIFVASGGSEKQVLEITKNISHIILLFHRKENSFAASMEIAAWLRSQNKKVSIIDVFAEKSLEEFLQVQQVFQALDQLKGQKAALIGEVSDWLIISDVEDEKVKQKLGIEVIRLPWEEIGHHHEKSVSESFLKYFPHQNPKLLQETSKVYQLLEETMEKKHLGAISVECFSMVKRDQVTACLPLAVLNAQNKVAACEGDMVSMIGKMMIRELTGKIPWQANIAEIKEESVLLAHCTVPLSAIDSFEVTTHFETGVGTAIQAKFEKRPMAIFRLNHQLDRYMLIDGEVVETPSHPFACRTQIELSVTKDQTQHLMDNNLGNHHLVFPAEHTPLIIKMMSVLGIDSV